jgi:glycosyltransferase involved in cell wall biosynthesis
MRVVQVISSLRHESGGPSYSVRRLAEELAERGIGSEVLSLGEAGEQAIGRAKVHFVAADATRLPGLATLLPSRDLIKALTEAARPGVLFHGHGLWRLPNIYTADVARRHGAPLVVSPRGMLSPAALAYSRWSKRAFWHAVQRRALASASVLHATSEAEAEDICAAGLKKPISIIPNGIDLPDEAEVASGRAVRAGEGMRTLLQLGRLHPIKRIDRLLVAWAQLEATHPQWKLRIVGPSEGGHRDELVALAQRLGVVRVTFDAETYGADKDATFRSADLVVLASESENFGMVVAEALANGVPVIATKGAPWQGLSSHRCGWWIEQGLEPLVAALDAGLSLDRASLDHMGARGRQWMLEDFSWLRVATDMEAVYHWALGQGSRPPSVEVF